MAAWIGVRAATFMWRTASANKNPKGSPSPATSLNSPHCRQGRSSRCWRIGASRSVRSAASTGCSTHTDRCIGAVEHGHHRNQEQCQGSGPQVRTSCGAGTSPICPPPCAGSGFTSTWCSTSGAAKWWPGM